MADAIVGSMDHILHLGQVKPAQVGDMNFCLKMG